MDSILTENNELSSHKLREGDDGTNEAAEITFTIIFYSLYALMLVAFWFVFKRGGEKAKWGHFYPVCTKMTHYFYQTLSASGACSLSICSSFSIY